MLPEVRERYGSPAHFLDRAEAREGVGVASEKRDSRLILAARHVLHRDWFDHGRRNAIH